MSNNSDRDHAGWAQLRADLPEQQPLEQEAVRTTIVGGRPPGSGKPMGKVPRGIEVLLKKAAIDPEFRELLLSDPEAAAQSIALELTPVEQAMLKTMPAEQLAVIINQTEVPQQQRRVFLGKSGAIMLALLAGAVGATAVYKYGGKVVGYIRDQTSMTLGIKPDMPDDRRQW